MDSAVLFPIAAVNKSLYSFGWFLIYGTKALVVEMVEVMRILLSAMTCAVIIGSTASVEAKGKFDGNLSFNPKGCEASRKCFLNEHFRYTDSQGMTWEARKGDKTDGASIPSWAQPSIGLPFDPSFIKAAVIHDHYCDRHVRSMLKTHWVFYDALRTTGVGEAKAKIMYAAVMIGGPKWIKLIPGKPCSAGTACIQSVERLVLPRGATRSVADDGNPIIARDANYDDPAVKAAIEEARSRIEADPNAVSLEDIEKMAENLPENAFFFRNADGITVAPSNDIKE